jgi:hypothetical protein
LHKEQNQVLCRTSENLSKYCLKVTLQLLGSPNPYHPDVALACYCSAVRNGPSAFAQFLLDHLATLPGDSLPNREIPDILSALACSTDRNQLLSYLNSLTTNSNITPFAFQVGNKKLQKVEHV